MTKLYDCLLYTDSALSVYLQIYVLWLVWRVSPSSMAEYRHLLTLFTCWDTAFIVLLGFLVHPCELYPMNGATVEGIARWFGQSEAYISCAAIIFAGVSVIVAQNYCLLYRLSVILSSQSLNRFINGTTGRIFLLSLSTLIASAYSLLMYRVYVVSEPAIQRDLRLYLDQSQLQAAAAASDTVIVYVDPSNPFIPRVIAAMMAFSVVSELGCLAIAGGILRVLRKEMAHFSRKTYRMHLQLTVLLVVQAASPILFVAIPLVMAMIYQIVLGYTLGPASRELRFLLLSFYSTNNAMLNIFFIAPYRRYTLYQLSRLLPGCMTKEKWARWHSGGGGISGGGAIGGGGSQRLTQMSGETAINGPVRKISTVSPAITVLEARHSSLTRQSVVGGWRQASNDKFNRHRNRTMTN